METLTVNPFSEAGILRWLERNSLLQAVECFHDGCCKIDQTRERTGIGCLDSMLCAATPELWIGYGLSCMLKQQRVWFASPRWKETEWAQVVQKVHPHLALGESVPLKTFTGIPGSSPSADPGVMIPTGGSSGDIKFAWHTIDTMAAAVDGVCRFFLGREMQQGDFGYRCDLPLWHISGWMQLMRAYLSDSTWEMNEESPPPISTTGYRWLSLVPTQLARILESSSIDMLRKADFVIIGGGACPVSLLRKAMRYGIAPWVTYGMTETAGMIAGKQIRNDRDLEVGASIFPHYEIAVDAPRGESGEILLRSRSLCLGYNGRRFPRDDWFLTGDLGSLTANHCLHMQGRMDSILNTGGEKVLPAEVQEIVGMYPAVADCRVVGVPDAEWGTKIACVYTTVDGKPLDPAMLKQRVSAKLSSYKIPKIWQHVKSIPYDAKGKITTSALIKLITGDAEKS